MFTTISQTDIKTVERLKTTYCRLVMKQCPNELDLDSSLLVGYRLVLEIFSCISKNKEEVIIAHPMSNIYFQLSLRVSVYDDNGIINNSLQKQIKQVMINFYIKH